MTVRGQARTANVRGPGAAGSKSGQTPGVRQNDPPGPGELPQTPWEIEGPYYRLGTPRRSSLLEPGDQPGLILTGRVLNPGGRPVAGAVVNFWHCNRDGEYDMVGYRYTGYVVTGDDGRYELTTIVPGAYLPRQAKHLHVKVQAVSRPVTTQLFLGGEPGNDADAYVAELWRPKGKGSFTRGFMREDHPGRVTIFDSGGAIAARWGASTVSRTAPGNFIAPHGIAVDSRGDLYVCEVSYTFGARQNGVDPAEAAAHQIQKFVRKDQR